MPGKVIWEISAHRKEGTQMSRKAVHLALGSVIVSMTCGCAADRASRELPVSENREKMMAEIKPSQQSPHESTPVDLSAAVSEFAPGWMVKNCGAEMSPGIRDELGKKNVLVTHPFSETMPCDLGRRVDILPDKKTTLHLVVGHHPEGDWLLCVTADRELVHKVIGKETAPDGWITIDVDLSGYAGQIITLQLINAANGWSYEAAYWARIEIE